MTNLTVAALDEEYAQVIDDEIGAWLGHAPGDLAGFYDMMRYQVGTIDETMAPIPHRERNPFSFLCFLTCAALKGSGRDAARAAAGIQLLTHFFQAHVDIETQASSVNGRPAAWVLWGVPQSINLGDGIFPLAGRAMLEAVDDPEIALTLFRGLAEVSLSHARGQYLELSLETAADMTPANYLEVIELKTGALSGYSAWTGALIGGGNNDIQQALRHFGSDLGVAHHIVTGAIHSSPVGPDLEREAHRATLGQLVEEHARQRRDSALAALRQVPLSLSGCRVLEEIVREMVPL